MRHKFRVLTVKKWLKSVYIYGSYRKIKTGVSLFLDHSVHCYEMHFAIVNSKDMDINPKTGTSPTRSHWWRWRKL